MSLHVDIHNVKSKSSPHIFTEIFSHNFRCPTSNYPSFLGVCCGLSVSACLEDSCHTSTDGLIGRPSKMPSQKKMQHTSEKKPFLVTHVNHARWKVPLKLMTLVFLHGDVHKDSKLKLHSKQHLSHAVVPPFTTPLLKTNKQTSKNNQISLAANRQPISSSQLHRSCHGFFTALGVHIALTTLTTRQAMAMIAAKERIAHPRQARQRRYKTTVGKGAILWSKPFLRGL